MTDKERLLIASSIEIPEYVMNLEEAEFSVFSQWGDDGIIQYLIKHLDIKERFFVEFGVEDYLESNTRYLMMKNNWTGMVIDGAEQNVQQIISSEYYWKYDLTAIQAFVDRDNIVSIIKEHCPEEIGLLHIDIDGMDYWIWEAIGQAMRPDIVILEYNSVFGAQRSITIPYRSDFQRMKAHHSGLYAGASLSAMKDLSESYDYRFIGCNGAGNNAYFVKNDLLNEAVYEVSTDQGYRESRFRESRDKNGKLTYLSGKDRYQAIAGLDIYNTRTNSIEAL